MLCRPSADQWKLINSCSLCCSLIYVDQTLPEREVFLKSCLSVFLSQSYPFLFLSPETTRSNLGFNVLQASSASSIQPLWQAVLTTVWLARCKECMHSFFTAWPWKRGWFSTAICSINECVFLYFCAFTAEPRQRLYHFPSTLFRFCCWKLNTPSVTLQTFRLQLGHIMLFYFWGHALERRCPQARWVTRGDFSSLTTHTHTDTQTHTDIWQDGNSS